MPQPRAGSQSVTVSLADGQDGPQTAGQQASRSCRLLQAGIGAPRSKVESESRMDGWPGWAGHVPAGTR